MGQSDGARPLDGADEVELLKYQAEHYHVIAVSGAEDHHQYEHFLREAYEPLGFIHESIRPSLDSRCYRVSYGGQISAIFRLTAVSDRSSPYFSIVPGAIKSNGDTASLLEINNVIVGRAFRATPALGVILRYCARTAAAEGYDFVVGTTRYQTLRYFVDFGVNPVDHAPLHLLGRGDLLDFVIFYDTADPVSCQYIELRAKHFFQQQYVLKSIQSKYRAMLPRVSDCAPRSVAIEGDVACG